MHYYIDGYNLLFRLQNSRSRSLEIKRQDIISSLNQEASLFKLNITIVFDGIQQAPDESTRTHYDALEIVYTPKRQTADAYILEQLEHTKKPAAETVITSDKQLALCCKMLGAQTQTIESFIATLTSKHKRKKQIAEPQKIAQDTPQNLERLLKIFEKRSESID